MEGLLGLAAVAGVFLGLVALVRTLDFGAKIETLEHEIASLRTALQRRAEPPRPAPETAQSIAPQPAKPQPTPVPSPAVSSPAPEPTPPVEALDRSAPPEREPSRAAPGAKPTSIRMQTTRIEARLSGNWLIWVGGAALAFGGAFLLKAAVDAGFFGPLMRIAAAFLAGFMMIAASEWARRTQAREIATTKAAAAWRRSIAPPVLAGAGGATLYATVYAAFAIYEMMPGLAALILLAGASATLIALAMLHGAPPLAQMGLAGAYLAPLLAGGETDGAGALLIYVFAVSTAGFFLMRTMNWRAAGLIALIGGLSWPAILSVAAAAPLGVALYLPAFVALAASAAWRDADAVPGPRALIGGASPLPISLSMFHLALIGVILLAIFAGVTREGAATAPPMWAAVSALTLAFASRRDGFALAPLAALGGALIATVASGDHGVGEPGASFALAVVFGVGGVIAMQFRSRKAPLAVAAGVGPVALLTLQLWLNRESADEPAVALAAIALTAANVGLLGHLRRQAGSFDAHPGAASAFVVGASFASCLAAVALFDGLFLSAALAMQTPVMALLWRRYRLATLKYLSAAIAIAASLRLLILPEVADYAFGPVPVVNLLIVAYAMPACAFWFAARAYEGGGVSRATRVVQALEGAAIALFAAFVSLEIRHLFNGGDIGARSVTLFELSLQIVSWMSIAAFMRWRFGGALTTLRRLAELALTGVSVAAALVGPLFHFHPIWGVDPEPVAGPPVFNLLLLFYLAPALAFAAASFAARRAGAGMQSRVAGVAAAVMGLAWLSLAVRQAFHAPDLSTGVAGLTEFSLNIIAWTLIAAALRWRYPAKGAPVIRSAENLLLGGAALLYAAVPLTIGNPWWGADAQPIGGAVLFNMTLVHFAAPALALTLAAHAAETAGAAARSRTLGLASAFAGLAFLVMEVRHAFHEPDLAGGGVGLAEGWSYSAGMTLYAAGLLVTGALRRSDILRRAGFAVLLLAIGKVFIIDLAGLDGLWRATAFLGLGAAIVGVAILYQRLNRATA